MWITFLCITELRQFFRQMHTINVLIGVIEGTSRTEFIQQAAEINTRFVWICGRLWGGERFHFVPAICFSRSHPVAHILCNKKCTIHFTFLINILPRIYGVGFLIWQIFQANREENRETKSSKSRSHVWMGHDSWMWQLITTYGRTFVLLGAFMHAQGRPSSSSFFWMVRNACTSIAIAFARNCWHSWNKSTSIEYGFVCGAFGLIESRIKSELNLAKSDLYFNWKHQSVREYRCDAIHRRAVCQSIQTKHTKKNLKEYHNYIMSQQFCCSATLNAVHFLLLEFTRIRRIVPFSIYTHKKTQNLICSRLRMRTKNHCTP